MCKSWFTGDDSAFSGFTVRLLKGGLEGSQLLSWEKIDFHPSINSVHFSLIVE